MSKIFLYLDAPTFLYVIFCHTISGFWILQNLYFPLQRNNGVEFPFTTGNDCYVPLGHCFTAHTLVCIEEKLHLEAACDPLWALLSPLLKSLLPDKKEP